ncbi:MAG: response regulator [Limnobacter sp.]|nr:response regulator [Limnobacter sp.]
MSDSRRLSGLKVMVIDDSNTIRRSAEIFLKQAGCEVILADDGFEALSKVADHEPHLIFCDILMPRLDGYQTCALIKKSPRYRDIPVVMLSSRDGLFDRARGRMVGSDQYLTKPFTKDALLRSVAERTAGVVAAAAPPAADTAVASAAPAAPSVAAATAGATSSLAAPAAETPSDSGHPIDLRSSGDLALDLIV